MKFPNGSDERELSRQDVSEESSGGGLEPARKPVLSLLPPGQGWRALPWWQHWQGGDGLKAKSSHRGTCTDGLLPILTILLKVTTYSNWFIEIVFDQICKRGNFPHRNQKHLSSYM